MKLQFVSFGLIMSLVVPTAFARDYSYMDDRPSSNTSASTSSGQSTGSAVLDSVVGAAVTATMDSVFSEDEKAVIRRYYRGYDQKDRRYDYREEDGVRRYTYDDDDYGKKHKKHKKHKNKKKSIPPGLRKKLERGGELPPGWQKKVQRGEVIDSELYSKSKPLPAQLRRKLPQLEMGTDVREIEGKVVKVLEASGIIVDAFDL